MKIKTCTLFGIISLILICHSSYAQINSSKTKTEKLIRMKEFSLLVRVPLVYSNEQAKAVNPAWEKVIEKWKRDGVYIYSFAFPGESYVVAGAEKSIRKEAVVASNLRVVSNIMLRAASVENALELAKDCPVLKYGGSVEVREIPSRAVFPADGK